MERDIVQFVPYREFKDNSLDLAKQTLEEIPGQLLSYMRKKQIPPISSQAPTLSLINYFDSLKQGFIQILKGLNYSDEKILEILSKGLPEYSVDLFKMHVFNPYFRNMLSEFNAAFKQFNPFQLIYSICLLYTSPSPRDLSTSRMPSSA
eukprot:TRINITY_DN45953_c0_g1_i1.p1 TRINITY_DN45953_c0_g1~~TRINITY_DN45953_c0_g1_i1.p1  ORF type:complete len:149 (+),score=18.94 TRINITY_DN45953_c0_g1_i1:212-658(+)